MPNVEKKLLLWIEKHMFLLMTLLIIAISLYLRRMAIWWNSPDVGDYFDEHTNNIQSSFYYLLVRWIQYLPMLPLHSIKWIVGITDYLTAALCLIAAGGYKEQLKLKSTFYFAVCVISPVVYLRGICWAQMDAIAFAFLVGAYIAWEREKREAGTVFALVGVTLYPCFFVIVLCWLIYRYNGIRGKLWIYLGALVAGVCLLQGICGLLIGRSWMDGLLSSFRWITYDPSGKVYGEPLLWIKQMVNLFGYGIAMISGIAAYRHKISYVATLLVHLVVLLVYGSLLFPVAM